MKPFHCPHCHQRLRKPPINGDDLQIPPQALRPLTFLLVALAAFALGLFKMGEWLWTAL